MGSFFGIAAGQASPIFDRPSFRYGVEQNLLDPIRPFYAENFTTFMIPMPGAAVLNANNPVGLSAYQQVEDRVQLPPGSWLVALSGYSAQSAGFRYSVFDEGRKQYALSNKWMDNGATASSLNPNAGDDSALPYVLPWPYYIVSPGWLHLRLVNSASVSNDAQLLLWFAVPEVGKGK